MILVQNHQRRLSGNNLYLLIVLACVCVVTMSSCARKMVANTDGRDIQIIKPDLPSDGTETEPKTPDVIRDVPVQKTESKTSPTSSGDPKKVVVKTDADFKSTYNVKILLPLKASSSADTDLSNAKYVQYYAGILYALDQLNNEDIKLSVEVFDTEGSAKIQDKMDEIIKPTTDLIIGPFEKEDVKAFAERCKEAAIPLVSPWQTSSKTTTDNPYYIQLKPNLREHFKKLAISIMSEYRRGEAVIVGKNNKDFNAWVAYFQEVAMEQGKGTDYFKTHYITEEAVSVGQSSFTGIISQKVLVFPNYSVTDETFLSNALRRLLSEKGSKNIVVYGMPILYESDKMDFEFYHGLNMRIVISDFVDEQYQDIKDFRRDYYDRYGEIATTDAIKGFDMMLYMGRNLWKHGRRFQYDLTDEAGVYHQSTFKIEKARAEDTSPVGEPDKFDFFENKHLDIIELKGSKFVVRP